MRASLSPSPKRPCVSVSEALEDITLIRPAVCAQRSQKKVPEAAAGVVVVIEDEAELCKKARVCVPWSKIRAGVRSEHRISRALRDTAHTKCAFCSDDVDEPCVPPTCENPAHQAHAPCWALIRSKIPNVSCPGALLSQCAPLSVSLTDEDRERITASAMPKLNEALAREVNRDLTTVTKQTRARSTKMRADFTRLKAAMEDPEWVVPTPLRFGAQSRSVMTVSESGSACCVCGLVVGMDALVTCKRHKAHTSCWAYFRALRDRMGANAPTECPAQYFCFPDCGSALRIPSFSSSSSSS